MMNTQAPQVPQFSHAPSNAANDRDPLLSQPNVVGAVSMTLAGISLLATIVLVLNSWVPAWVTTLALTVVLTALSLAVFASADPRSRLRNFGFATPGTKLSSLVEGQLTRDVDTATTDNVTAEEVAAEEVAAEEVAAEEVLLEDDEQDVTAVRQVNLLMNRQARPAAPPTRNTQPLFRKSTQPSIAR
jgi:hypothetical protein